MATALGAGVGAPTIGALISSWRRSLAAANKSPRTIRRYVDDATLLATYLADNKLPAAVAAIAREHLEMFVSWQLRQHRPSSAATRFRSVAQFFKWAVEEGELRESPMARMREPGVPDSPIPVIPDAELARILATCENRANFRDRRDAAIMLLLIDAGLRSSELCGIALTDVDLDRGIVRVLHAKGRRVRNVPFGARTTKALDRYMRARAAHKDAGRDELFLGERGPVTASGLRQILETRSAEAGVPMRSAHKWRHTSVHLALSAGASEGDAMTVYGWKSRQMLARYGSAQAEARAIEAHRRFGPADRLGQREWR